MKKTILLFCLLTATFGLIKGQNVNIPDANFKTYLVGNTSINTNGDSEIQVSEAIAFSGSIDCSIKNITNLTGIEAFVNIKELYCSANHLASFDISKNTALTRLDCTQNQLTSLDISKNIGLSYLDCSANQLTSLVVNKNTVLKNLYCFNNKLTSLDVKNNTDLIVFWCYGNQLTSLDVTKNLSLQTLICYNNQLSNIDVSKNLVLKELHCYRNQLTSLDVSKNVLLTKLSCDENQLTSLNLKNGNNAGIVSLYADKNPNLTCIQVDNVANSNSYIGWQKDNTASYNTNCILAVNDISKKGIAIYPNPVKNILSFSEEVSNVKITDLSGRMVKQVSVSAKSVNVSALAKGVYIISATTKFGETVNRKIVKE